MKCKYCDGDGVIVDVEYGHAGKYICGNCDGTGVVEPMTNEEWLRSCSADELAGAIYEWFTLGFTRGKNGKKLNSVTEVVEWLKQPHLTSK